MKRTRKNVLRIRLGYLINFAKSLITCLFCLLVLFLTGCQTTNPKIVLDFPILDQISSLKLNPDNQLSDLILVKDLRWDPILIGKDERERYINLDQGHIMEKILKNQILGFCELKNITNTELVKWMGKEKIISISILEISLGQGIFAEDPYQSLALRERKWISFKISNQGGNAIPSNSSGSGWNGWVKSSIPLFKTRSPGSSNKIGAKVVLGFEVLDLEGKSLIKRVVIGQELLNITEANDFKIKAQATLKSAYSQALNNLIDMIASEPEFETLSDIN